ncbi:hypothetical protein GBA52_008130 [Prunus armeniaca]|nr:hypothetical protein GBA52_008130 [Prunus armeniaca]
MKFGLGEGGTKGYKEEQWEEEKKSQEDDVVAATGYRWPSDQSLLAECSG